MKILSLFDGMSCGYIAMLMEGVAIDRYVAYEIDKYAVETSKHNFPGIEHKGDVFKGDFTEYRGFDWLVGGSPCTYWSIAQKNNRETEASGLGWELFSQYVRALREAQPKWFLYENNKSMSSAIRESISKEFGFEPVFINSALVSAQNRQRLYWVGRRNKDGTYSKVDVPLPEDRGILLKDILETGKDLTSNDKSYCVTATYTGACGWNTIERSQRTMIAESVCMRYERSEEAKAVRKLYESGEIRHGFRELHELHPRTDGKSNTVSTVLKDNPICEPVNTTVDGKAQCLRATCYKDGIRNMVGNDIDKKTCVAEPIKVGEVNGGGQGNRIYSVEGKAVSQAATSGGMGSNTGLYAVPVEFENDIPVKAMSYADGKTYQVYKVKNGLITINGKEYPIKLSDGFYIIRKLTVRECMRLQTVPEWFEFPASDSQAYKMLGNGWTVEVIRHLINCTLKGGAEE